MVFWVVLAEFLSVEVILGAFLAGAVLSLINRGEKADLHDKLDAIGSGFFIPIFFINVGANFDLRALLVSPTALVLLPVLNQRRVWRFCGKAAGHRRAIEKGTGGASHNRS